MNQYLTSYLLLFATLMFSGCAVSSPPLTSFDRPLQASGTTGYKSIYSFGHGTSDGTAPRASLIDAGGVLLGTTYSGGGLACVGGCGTIYSIKPSGKEAILYRFTGGSDGANPASSLTPAGNVYYGTTRYGGGQANEGTVFEVDGNGHETIIHSFLGYYYQEHYYNDGANPVASVIYEKGILYGTTYSGGDDPVCTGGCGTVFKITKAGHEKVIHSFQIYSDGALPSASLLQVKGTLYGSTEAGGSYSSGGPGAVFKIDTRGKENVIHYFQGSDGAVPAAGLTSRNGLLYGTTGYEGPNGGGTVFSMTLSGALTNLHSFGGGVDGSRPLAPLIDIDGTLYGTTSLGGMYGKGTIFAISRTGANERVLHDFGHGSDGATPLAGLVDVKDTLYGTTSAGGTNGKGTVFALKL